MISMKNIAAAAIVGSAMFAAPASALVVTEGPGGFDNGFATAITYENDNAIAQRGTSNDRDNPLNALGAADGNFFEIGFGSFIDLTFGTLFDTSVSVFEITFGDRSAFPESADISVGLGGSFQSVGSISNANPGELSTVIASSLGVFDTVRITDTSSPVNGATLGGFDVDAVRVQPVPLPAGILLLLTAMGGMILTRRRQTNRIA